MDGSRLSQGQFLFVPDTVPPNMFMLIVFFAQLVFGDLKTYGLQPGGLHPILTKQCPADGVWRIWQ